MFQLLERQCNRKATGNMDLKSKLYKQFDEEGIKGKRRSIVRLLMEPGETLETEEFSDVFLPSTDYYNLSQDILEELIINYIYDTTSFELTSVQDLKKLKNINGVPFILELNSDNPDQTTYTLAKRLVHGSVTIKSSKIISLGNIEEIDGDLALIGSSIQSLGKLRKVTGSLWVAQFHPFTNLEDLANLEYVGKDLYLKSSPIKTLSNLSKVGRTLNLRNTSIESLGKLAYVGHCIYLPKSRKEFFDLTGIHINGKVRYYQK
ncbi:hypothetical protein [Terrimonas pollutisoli]|uniref:hypothetical protein n=1 Tax=Terrimonas pollutisoli TaxID=3034147 RepID=UPI0023ECFEB7|nr:hypothetical protein [Terrimonas sp. H1YJ31]